MKAQPSPSIKKNSSKKQSTISLLRATESGLNLHFDNDERDEIVCYLLLAWLKILLHKNSSLAEDARKQHYTAITKVQPIHYQQSTSNASDPPENLRRDMTTSTTI